MGDKNGKSPGDAGAIRHAFPIGLEPITCGRGYTGRYAKAMTFFRTIKREYGRKGGDEEAAERQFTAPQLLVLDEMQVRGDTKWEDDQLTDLIDTRYQENRVTVLITNLTPRDSKTAAGESVDNRLRQGGVYIECAWPSLRPVIEPPELFGEELPLGDGVRDYQ